MRRLFIAILVLITGLVIYYGSTSAQTHTFPALDTNNAFTGNNTFAGTTGLNGVATLISPIINTGISQGSGFKHQRFAGGICTTAAAAGATCDTVLTWTTTFADSNYTEVCVGEVPTNIPVLTVGAKVAASITVRLVAASAGAATFSNVVCIAVHD